jgi:hypothetical protein
VSLWTFGHSYTHLHFFPERTKRGVTGWFDRLILPMETKPKAFIVGFELHEGCVNLDEAASVLVPAAAVLAKQE